MKYECDPRFDTYYLEDSYVLGFDESEPGRLAFSLLLVLTSKHPLYSAPKLGEQYCYRKGMLTFEKVNALHWARRSFTPTHDADGELDFGNIDIFEIEPERRYCLEGEWGQVILKAHSASITLS